MIGRKPEGYKDLLAYKKAQEVKILTESLVACFPKTKTLIDLADQMSRSGRSLVKNITEGWMRNTTKEYFQFLGFSIGSNSELMEDAADIVTGVYSGLRGIKGIMGEGGIMGREELDGLRFYPLDESLPPVVKLFLKCKEVNYLLYKLQQSLDVKMDEEGTRTVAEKLRLRQDQRKQEDLWLENAIKERDMVILENGQVVEKDKGKKRD
jgi:hypothetical protein